jgi:hypothetical protein
MFKINCISICLVSLLLVCCNNQSKEQCIKPTYNDSISSIDLRAIEDFINGNDSSYLQEELHVKAYFFDTTISSTHPVYKDSLQVYSDTLFKKVKISREYFSIFQAGIECDTIRPFKDYRNQFHSLYLVDQDNDLLLQRKVIHPDSLFGYYITNSNFLYNFGLRPWTSSFTVQKLTPHYIEELITYPMYKYNQHAYLKLAQRGYELDSLNQNFKEILDK